MTHNCRTPAIHSQTSSTHANLSATVCIYTMVVVTAMLAACTTSTVAPPAVETAAPAAPPSVAVVPPPVSPMSPDPTPAQVLLDPPTQHKEPPPVDLPNYAKRGKRLPAHGGVPGRAVIAYCRSFEIDKDAQSYFRTLRRNKRLPSTEEIAELSRLVGQPQTIQQVVERDWALRRASNRSAPQRCKVLGGSIDGATALIVFEAELNGRRQRGIATVLESDQKWRVRDHGDWAQVK